MFSSGMRQLALRILTKSAFISPWRISFMGGMRMPSWKISFRDGAMLEGTVPPTSVEWMKHQP